MIKESRNQIDIFTALIVIYVLIMTSVFFLTKNPYFAFHNNGADVIGEINSFVINPYIILLFTCCISLISIKNLFINLTLVILFFLMGISALYNGILLSSMSSYITIMFTFLSAYSIATYLNNFSRDIKYIKLLMIVLNVIFILGIIAALFFPMRYGYLPFEFSRATRGEITLWNITSLYVLYPVISLLYFVKTKKIYQFYFYAIMIIIIISTASRTLLIVSILPFAIFILFELKGIYKSIFIIILLAIISYYSSFFSSYFLLNDSLNQNDITNGRAILWKYNWDYFIENPIFGNGIYFLHRYNDYTGIADSEIGLLLFYSEHGILVGLIFTILIIVAFLQSCKNLMRFKLLKEYDFIFTLIYLSLLPGIVEKFGRIFKLEDLIFWISVFYLANKSILFKKFAALLSTKKVKYEK